MTLVLALLDTFLEWNFRRWWTGTSLRRGSERKFVEVFRGLTP